jgi:hypothetical protein
MTRMSLYLNLAPSRTHIVPDLVSRIRDVILVRRIFSSGKPQGVGILEWGGDGEGRSVYEQPGTKVDGILSHQGGFPSKQRDMEEKQREIRRGSKSKGIAP